ncbi:uncharacterized protein [Solanum lycopersicum]|uniref:uncharacterized protein n=1 Tax=Solanum lycopersicum TaxID=4081 RepID=UPI0037493E38
MTTRSATTRWVEEDIANAGVPPQDNQDPPKEQAPLGGQAMVNPPVMTNGDIKAKLDAYKLKDVAQTWYTQWKDNRDFRAGPISWEVFWKEFLDSFFPRDKNREKGGQLINLHQGGMSFQEYFLKFIKLSMYSSSLVTNLRDEMSHFVMGVSDDHVEECRVAMLHNDMDLYRLMVHDQQVEESRLKSINRDAKRGRPYDEGTSKGKFEI